MADFLKENWIFILVPILVVLGLLLWVLGGQRRERGPAVRLPGLLTPRGSLTARGASMPRHELPPRC